MALLWYYTMVYIGIPFNAIICNYRAYKSYYIMRYCRTMILYYYMRMWCDTVILCADTFKRLFAAVRKGKCDLLCNTEKVNIIYSKKYSKLF